MKPRNFFGELKRRNVYKVAVAYAVVGWLLVQVATQVFPFFEIPNWAVRLVVLAIMIGFPIALVIAWAFELTPEGLKRTEDVDGATEKRGKSHAWIYVVVVGAVLSIGLFFLGRYSTANNIAPRPSETGSSIPQKSIAVLPFENLSSDKENAYLADGIQDEILTKLASIADLRVISRAKSYDQASPVEKDAMGGPAALAGLAEIQARAGEPGEAVKTLRRLLSIPAGVCISLQRLKIDPVWDPIRNDPGFQQLFAGKEQIGPIK
jgi:hypothetical protein